MNISPFLVTSPINSPFNAESVVGKKLEEKSKSDKADKSDKPEFKSVLTQVISDVNDTHITANDKIEGLIRGDEGISMHDVMLSMQESQMSTQLLIEARNKLFDCYQELNRTSL